MEIFYEIEMDFPMKNEINKFTNNIFKNPVKSPIKIMQSIFKLFID